MTKPWTPRALSAPSRFSASARVKVGSYATRAEAEKRLGALKARGVQGFVTDAR